MMSHECKTALTIIGIILGIALVSFTGFLCTLLFGEVVVFWGALIIIVLLGAIGIYRIETVVSEY